MNDVKPHGFAYCAATGALIYGAASLVAALVGGVGYTVGRLSVGEIPDDSLAMAQLAVVATISSVVGLGAGIVSFVQARAPRSQFARSCLMAFFTLVPRLVFRPVLGIRGRVLLGERDTTKWWARLVSVTLLGWATFLGVFAPEAIGDAMWKAMMSCGIASILVADVWLVRSLSKGREDSTAQAGS